MGSSTLLEKVKERKNMRCNGKCQNTQDAAFK